MEKGNDYANVRHRITRDEVREARRNGQSVRFGTNDPTRILSKKESEIARQAAAEH